MRVIFVGVHYKAGMQALDSRTRSGKLIDRVIEALQIEVDLFGAEFIKSNVFNLEYWPISQTDQLNRLWVENWRDRLQVKSSDIVITLGQTVNEIFRKAKQPSIKIGHPSACWSKLKQEEYIINACIKVSEVTQSIMKAV